MQLCTIIARNYLAHARVLANSLAEHQPDARLAVLVLDADGSIHGEESFELLSPADIHCEEFDRMIARYELLELATAVKPQLLRFLLGRGAPAVTYLDPDIQVFSSLTRLDELGTEHGIVLIPHNTVPIPSDGERPTQMAVLLAGVFNLGYVTLGAGPQAERLLDWWSARLLRECRNDVANGYFVDQRWMDLVPGLFEDYAIVRDPAFNLAYWNLHAHDFKWDGERYIVDGRPLAFFHFSGFDPDHPDVLSRHQTRVRTCEHPAVARICRDYAAALEAHGHAETRTWSYRNDVLPDGTRFTPELRRLFQLGEDRGELHRSPFGPRGAAEFRNWLTGQEEGGAPGISRGLTLLYRQRTDLQTAFPDLNGAHRSAFLGWARTYAVKEGMPEWLVPPPGIGDDPQRFDAQAGPPPGVNVVGYFASELGLGEAARQLVGALDAVGLPLLPLHGPSIPLNRQGHRFPYLEHGAAGYPINLICMNADVLPEFARQVGDPFFSERYSIGLWFWEVNSPPPGEWRDAFALLDEVWVASEHVARVVASVAPIPVVRVTMPVELPVPQPMRPGTLGLTADDFTFLFSFDYQSVFERKNPLSVVRAFRAAFEPGSGASLVIKSINSELHLDARARLLEAVGDRPDIRLIEHYLAAPEKDALTALCDCYVSLHRSEGFGHTMAEAMFLGKPVIATGYSGNLDFMTPYNSYLVDYQLVKVGQGAPPYPAGGEWAEPSVEHAARLMRHVFENRLEAHERGHRAAMEIRRSHSPQKAGQEMLDRLTRAHARVVAQHERLGSSIERSAEKVRRGPVAGGARSLPRRALRRSVLRLMKPFTAYQLSVNETVVDGLQDLALRLQIANADIASERMRQARTRDAATGSADGATALLEPLNGWGAAVEPARELQLIKPSRDEEDLVSPAG